LNGIYSKNNSNLSSQSKSTQAANNPRSRRFSLSSVQSGEDKLNIGFAGWLVQVVVNTLKKVPTPEWALFQEGKKKVKESLNILHIMKKLRDVDKIKALLLNKDQRILFDNLPRPVLEPISKKNLLGRLSTSHGFIRSPSIDFEDQDELAVTIYKTLKEKEDKTELD